MAYTKAPSISTNSSERMDFVYNAQGRVGNSYGRDAYFVNCMLDTMPSPNKENSRVVIKSRPGLSLAYTLDNVTGGGRGLHYWIVGGVGYIITVTGNAVMSNGVFLMSLGTTIGPVGFTEHVNSTGVVTLFMCDGTSGYVFSSPTVSPTPIADPDFPTPHIPMPIFLDGYIFLAKPNTEDIYNSDLNLPASWTSGNYISAEMYPDNLVALSKNNNYIYAIGRTSIEYLYNAAVVNGSPLQRETSAVQQFGTPAPATVLQTEKEVVLVGDTGNGGATVWTIDGFKPKEISTPYVRSVLLKQDALLSSATACCVRTASQKLYILNLPYDTLVYSFDTEMWTRFNSGVSGGENFRGGFGTDGPNQTPYILIDNGSSVCTFSEEVYTDIGEAIYITIQTPKYDFGTINQKFMSRFTLIGDMPSNNFVSNDPATNKFYISWTDDDYVTYSVERELDMSRDMPYIAQLGRFRRRAFKISYSSPKLIRLDAIEVDINKGSS